MNQPDERSTDQDFAKAGSPMGNDAGEPPLEPMALEPSEAELDEWAERERKRREAWLNGPTAEERAAYAKRIRERRLLELEGGEDPWSEWGRQMVKYPREVQLAMEGAMSLMLRWSRRSFEELQRAGREWEQEFGNPIRRRRIPLDDDRP
jgi:hypothetical protein